MGLTLTDWMLYTMWAVFGLMILDFLIGFLQSFWRGTFDTSFLSYLKDILYYVLPLNVILSMVSIDPTGWILLSLYFIGGISVALKYILDIVKKFRKPASSS
ncbi:hypothetical protein LJK87_05370 [Paenibacillus sp. P25]|nr:hypothetical protein LJK87_05370 [Paenibacillus sp. P25]